MGSCLSVCYELEAMHVHRHASVGSMSREGEGRPSRVPEWPCSLFS